MEPREHGGNPKGLRGMLDFSANVNPLGLPPRAREALLDSLDGWHAYPDPHAQALTAALAEIEQVPAPWIQLGPGAADLIFRVALGLRPRRALTLAPTFSEYRAALTAAGCQMDYHLLLAEQRFALDDSILERLDGSFDLVVLCNPNNPTGQTAEPELLRRILARCQEQRALLLVDECFNPFLDFPEQHTLKPLLGEYPNLLLLKAFTKLYAMAGLRLGYLLCADGRILRRLQEVSPSWSVSTPAQVAGLAALSDQDYLERTRSLIPRERRWLREGLEHLGLQVLGGEANYLFFRCEQPQPLAPRIQRHGVLIRSCENYPGLDAHYNRVAVRTRSENERLLQVLEQSLREEI